MHKQLFQKIFYRKTGLINDPYQLKKNFEVEEVELFLRVYNEQNDTDFRIVRTQESPDVVCKDSKGKYISIDPTDLFGTQKVIDENTRRELVAFEKRELENVELIEETLETQHVQERIDYKDHPEKFANAKGERILVICLDQYAKAKELVSECKNVNFKKAKNFDSCFLLWINESKIEIDKLF